MSRSGMNTGQRQVPGLSIANTMNPMQKGPYRSMIEPGEISGANWQWSIDRAQQDFKLPPKWQSDNYFDQGEGYKSIKNGMYGQLTGREPMYGHMDYPRNPLDQNQTNMEVNDMYKMTQYNWSKGLKVLRFDPSRYPQVKDYLNFQGSTLNRM